MNNRDGYVTKKTKGVVVLKDEHSLIKRKKKAMRAAATLNKSACEQCSLCTDLCPRHLLGHSTSPHKMVRAMSVSYTHLADAMVKAANVSLIGKVHVGGGLVTVMVRGCLLYTSRCV